MMTISDREGQIHHICNLFEILKILKIQSHGDNTLQ